MSSIASPRPTVNAPRRLTAVRVLLGAFLAFCATAAFGGGIYGLTGAPSVPVAWLQGSPFESYFVPSLILFVIVGGSLIVAAIAVFFAAAWARHALFACAAILLVWIAVQVAVIGYTSFLQVAVAMIGALLLLLAIFLPSLSSLRSSRGVV